MENEFGLLHIARIPDLLFCPLQAGMVGYVKTNTLSAQLAIRQEQALNKNIQPLTLVIRFLICLYPPALAATESATQMPLIPQSSAESVA
jgi:hypothetical protein